MQQPIVFTSPHAYNAMMETLSRDLVKYVSSLNPHRCQNSNLVLKFLMMSILVLLSVVLYMVATSYNMVVAMKLSQPAYLTSESSSNWSTSSPSSFQTNASYCITSTCVQQAAQIIQSLNPAQDPCEDFYEFTCGNWVKRRPITDDQSSITEFGRLRNELNQKIKKLLNLKVKKREPLYMDYMRLIYRQCLNTTAIEKEESKPLLEVLNKLDGWPLLNPNGWNRSNFDLIDTLIKIKNLGFSHLTLFSIHPGVDITNNTNYLINIDQCSFSLSSRKYYLSNRDNKLLATYRSSIVESALLLNATASKAKIEEYAMSITDFEKSLALVAQLPENRRNYTRIYNKMTVAELEEFAPNTNWRKLLAGFTNLPVSDETLVNVKELEYVKSVDKLLTKTDKTQLANYLIWRVVFSSMPQLNNNWRAIYEKLNRIVSGRKSEKQRWSTCMQKLFGSFNVPISALYVRTYFDPKSKKVAEEIINNIKQEFIQMLSALEWMDPDTKARAIKKAEAITTYVGYSPEILDHSKVMELYAGLELREKWSYFTNIQKLRRHWADQDFRKLTGKNLKTDWKKFSEAASKFMWMVNDHWSHNVTHIDYVNAFYNSLENAVKFPSGILTGIFYDKNRPKYLNYGALGYIVGHEIIHGFDDRGRQFDENGNFQNWWSDETDEKFRKMSNCLVEQYNGYHVNEVNMSVNGALTIGENIADTGGLKQAYNGYRRHVKLNGEDPLLPGLNYTQNQLFWISSSSIWCSNYRPEAMKARITTGVHSPPKYRVIGSITNNPDFARDFNCKLGANKMNPSNKCLIWA